ncbi:carboxypeptidase regulatory-like domain-containing protein [Sphingomonas sp. RP10(2022)]|uniref:Carboxypeptidase regulatory-like domain-containing protein n=1 Tax=Sphingomonas liriopis TaxID=2949094 RepID=A0A9X2HRW8_9SPHN|nr:carboxypeptidase regulatory-like domain-containing protein [Sphingomonas liriopis]MCP3734737.1 carboxypeptidase regulatory-like domain-containing protein [Sphingomonas liriopis]
MSAERIVAALLALAVAIAWVRLGLWQARAPIRAARWRLAALVVLQPIVAGSLYLTLFAPSPASSSGTLVVATEGASRLVAIGPGETLVALPEARGIAGAERAPDLAAALRRHAGATALRIVGSGLAARDRPAASSVTLRYAAPPAPTGLVALTPSAPVAPGEPFRIAARVTGGGTASLLDPAGRVVDTARPAADGSVILHGTARVPGEALFTLRTAGEQAPVPLVTRAATPARALILAAAPGPEVKFLRRWAADAGLTAETQAAVGGGVALGDPGVALTPSALARYDLLILDDRSWAGLGGSARGGVAQAVRGGLGLVVRLTGPVPRGWQLLGLPTGGGAAATPLRLPPAAPGDAALVARRGPGTRDAPATIAAPLGEVPELKRMAVPLGGIPLLRDARGTPFAAWQGVGRGRVAVTTLLDSFALVTSGNGDAHAAIWSALAATVGRGTPDPGIRIGALPRVGERTPVCATGSPPAVIAPDGTNTPLVPDPHARACAGYWPRVPGWHRLGEQPFYVYPADALPQLRATVRREATLALVGERRVSTQPQPRDPQPSWRWLLAFLAATATLWWIERRRRAYSARAVR